MLVTLFASRLSVLVEGCQRLLQKASDPYRPELHYMRGPGPACRAKQRGDQL
jgi:hypothetical protein